MTIHILVGTTSGNTEALADVLHQQLETHNYQVQFHDEPKLEQIPTLNSEWLICVATHGAGDYADSIAGFIDELTSQQPDLSSVTVHLIAIGDSSYDTFCDAGKNTQSLVSALGAKVKDPVLFIDMQFDPDPEKTALTWLSQIKNLPA